MRLRETAEQVSHLQEYVLRAIEERKKSSKVPWDTGHCN